MNLNEQCLLNFLLNSGGLNDLIRLLSEYFNKNQQDFPKIEYNISGTINE